ncbi:MAG: FixH family protein [Melioribacteraceae bacterium]|nr:FixH family protein [Melioribacteraceae bacterium]
MKYIKSILVTLLLTVTLISCKEDNPVTPEPIDPAEGLTKVGEHSFSEIKAEVYTDAAIEVGYCKFYVKLTKLSDNSLITSASVKLKTLMDMGTMKHSSPLENISGTDAINSLFPSAAVFIMSGMWEITIEVENSGEFTIPLEVAPSSNVKKVNGSDNKTYFVTLINPMDPKVGLNDFEISIHTKESMMLFPAVEDVNVTMEPSMPSMGHGSPNNVNPVHQADGHYLGKVNFTMTGDWLIDLYLSKTDSLLVTSFNITL